LKYGNERKKGETSHLCGTIWGWKIFTRQFFIAEVPVIEL
jgi:hypothetical protein